MTTKWDPRPKNNVSWATDKIWTCYNMISNLWPGSH